MIILISESFYSNAEQYFETLLTDIAQARQSIEISVYIFENDAVGKSIIRALEAASRRGVSIRLLVDGVGISDGLHSALAVLLAHRGELKIFHPVPWRFIHWRYAVTRRTGFSKMWHLAIWVNKRNHQKFAIIDRNVKWIGSYNFCADHLPHPSTLDSDDSVDWLDAAIRIEGCTHTALLDAFDLVWNDSKSLRLSGSDPYHFLSPYRLNFQRKLRVLHRRLLLEKFDAAIQQIAIINAYFVPDHKLLKALTDAAKRGVKVSIMISSRSDVFFMPWASAVFYGALIEAGARVYECRDSIIHAKVTMVDDWATVGSSNLNKRSLHHDLECDYEVQCESTRQSVNAFADSLITSNDLLDTEGLDDRFWRRLAGWFILLLFGYWI